VKPSLYSKLTDSRSLKVGQGVVIIIIMKLPKKLTASGFRNESPGDEHVMGLKSCQTIFSPMQMMQDEGPVGKS